MRELDENEKKIISVKEERNKYKSGKKYDVKFVEYRKLFPRSVLCVLSKVPYPTIDKVIFGITMRGKGDEECESVGEAQSFIRALNSM